MSVALQAIILLIGLFLCALVILLLVRKKINERNTLVWLFGVIVVFVITVNPKLLDTVAKWAGVSYPPSLLFLISSVILFLVALYQSIQISQLYARIKEISQQIALRQEQTEPEADGPHGGQQTRREA